MITFWTSLFKKQYKIETKIKITSKCRQRVNWCWLRFILVTGSLYWRSHQHHCDRVRPASHHLLKTPANEVKTISKSIFKLLSVALHRFLRTMSHSLWHSLYFDQTGSPAVHTFNFLGDYFVKACLNRLSDSQSKGQTNVNSIRWIPSKGISIRIDLSSRQTSTYQGFRDEFDMRRSLYF